jgi:tellurite resistance protein
MTRSVCIIWLILACFWPLSVDAQLQDESITRSSSNSTQAVSNSGLSQSRAQAQMITTELQGIVVLCATGQYSSELDKKWKRYLQQNYAADLNLDSLLNDIQQRAGAYRVAMYVQTEPVGSRQAQYLSGIMKSMHDTAKAVIQNMR